MLKPSQLQQRLIEQVPLLHQHPEKLVMVIGAGNVVSTLATSLSFEYHFPLTLTVSDNAVSDAVTDQVVVTVLKWLGENQPDILSSSTRRLTDFAVTPLTDRLTITLQLTERVQVQDLDGVQTITHLPEPPLPENNARPHQVYLNGELISQWTE
ncbi:phage tail protein [Enterobacterales bacterium]|nr:phage tail protein [Enterobacterales bacterium]